MAQQSRHFDKFVEATYLDSNPDVLDAVRRGVVPSGLVHYLSYGYREGRPGTSQNLNGLLTSLSQDGPPMPEPPPKLRKRVHGDESQLGFDTVGKDVCLNIEASLQMVSVDLGDRSKVLDFGCGCGRVLRWFRKLHPSSLIYGADIDAEAISWCQQNLSRIGNFVCNREVPPLPFAEECFDFVYSISVLTHLPEDMQFGWLAELRRVAKKGSYLAITVHGEELLPGTAAAARGQLKTNGFYYLGGQAYEGLPEFYSLSYHTQDYVRSRWSKFFEIVDVIKKGIGNHQDLVLCRRRDE